MEPLDWVTLSLAVLGSTLGLFNAYRGWRRDQIQLKVVPLIAFPSAATGDTRPRLAIEVSNLGNFPVTVHRVGWIVKGSRYRQILSIPDVFDGGRWPRRLEPYSSVTAYSSPDQDHSWLRNANAAFAETAGDRVVRGTSGALKWLRRTGQLPAPITLGGQAGMLCVSDDLEALAHLRPPGTAAP
jgi:hypothetical protein